MIDWNDPAARARLIARIGPDAYNKAHAEHIKQSTIKTVNGYPIRSVGSRFGRLFQVMGSGVAFRTLAEAEACAAKLSPKKA